jgi:hypothetical protein
MLNACGGHRSGSGDRAAAASCQKPLHSRRRIIGGRGRELRYRSHRSSKYGGQRYSPDNTSYTSGPTNFKTHGQPYQLLSFGCGAALTSILRGDVGERNSTKIIPTNACSRMERDNTNVPCVMLYAVALSAKLSVSSALGELESVCAEVRQDGGWANTSRQPSSCDQNPGITTAAASIYLPERESHWTQWSAAFPV